MFSVPLTTLTGFARKTTEDLLSLGTSSIFSPSKNVSKIQGYPNIITLQLLSRPRPSFFFYGKSKIELPHEKKSPEKKILSFQLIPSGNCAPRTYTLIDI